MNLKLALYVTLVFVAVFAIAAPTNSVFATSSNYNVDGEDGEYEGKSCPSKEKKSASVLTVPHL